MSFLSSSCTSDQLNSIAFTSYSLSEFLLSTIYQLALTLHFHIPQNHCYFIPINFWQLED